MLYVENENCFRMAVESEAQVLILGPTGTGKTTLAKKIHDQSSRKGHPFVTVNLGTMHEGTLEAELFGYEKGAFTGAEAKRIGRLEQAQGGTVFLDEVGELAPRLQSRLLDFLQARTIVPLGSNREVRLDVRVIAATNKSLSDEVKAGKFREDLFHRLRVLTFHLKPIRERAGEFDQAVHYFLDLHARKYKKRVLRLSEIVARKLERYSWPGNLRELSNVAEFMVLSARGEEIMESDLPHWFTEAESSGTLLASRGEFLGVAELPMSLNFHETLERFEKEFLKRALSRYRGRINQTARETRMNKTTLIRRIRAYGLSSWMRDRQWSVP